MPMLWNYQELTDAAERHIERLALKAERDLLHHDISQQTINELYQQAQGGIDLWDNVTMLHPTEPTQIEDHARLERLLRQRFATIQARPR